MINNSGLDVPVLFIIFNRSDTAIQVLNQIRKAKPKKIYLFSDGPRKGRLNEENEVRATREKIEKSIDWNCELRLKYLEINIGPKYAIGYAVNWMFENEESGIVLEHDCLPNDSFFLFCSALLNKYRFNEKVMHITGNNFLFGRIPINTSYYFSNLSNPTWGWATWKRAWKHYDPDIAFYPEFVRNFGLERVVKSGRVKRYYKRIFDNLYKGKVDTWDYQWSLAIWNSQGVCITPAFNLVSNIGYDRKAINTIDPNEQFAAIPTFPLEILNHPDKMEVNGLADDFVLQNVIRPIFVKRIRILKRFFKMKVQQK